MWAWSSLHWTEVSHLTRAYSALVAWNHLVSGLAYQPTLDGPSSSHCQVHFVVLLGKTLDSHSASLNPGTKMATCKYNGGNPYEGLALHPEILLVASSYRNQRSITSLMGHLVSICMPRMACCSVDKSITGLPSSIKFSWVWLTHTRRQLKDHG